MANKTREYDESRFVVATLREVLHFFGVSRQTIDNWRLIGMPGHRGAWNLAEIARWRRQRDLEKHGSTDEPTNGKASKLDLERRKLALQCDREELQLHEQRGELVRRDTAEAAFTEMCNRIRGRLEAAPEELATSLPGDRRADFIHDAKHRIRLICKEMAHWAEDDGSD